MELVLDLKVQQFLNLSTFTKGYCLTYTHEKSKCCVKEIF